ncbi:tetratricopeptide repeat protein [Sulfurimonas sp.]|uniref:tetratricopeptide repeat protein n=1 Tax=Sulfurimonas sp. TaxID=2022749 RepID=UPI002B478D3E|nr:tetratricopeptide repeat protein [Sulfurimonas sp.]
MKYKLLKLLFLASLFIGQSAYAIEPLSIKYVDPKASEKADSLYNKAHRLSEQGKYKESAKLFKESFEYNPKKDAAFNLGLAYKNSKDYKNAIKWYKKSFEMGNADGGG